MAFFDAISQPLKRLSMLKFNKGAILAPAAIVLFVLSTMPAIMSCDDRTNSAETSQSPAKQRSAQAALGQHADARSGQGPIIDGAHFTVRKIIDTQQGGIPVCSFIAPQKWPDKNQVVWNYGNTSSPVTIAVQVENPANEEAFFAYPAVQYFCLRPDSGFFQPGQNYRGLIFTHQQLPPVQVLLAVIQRLRYGQNDLRVVGSKDLPGLPRALRLPPSKNQRGIGIKITYLLNGKPMEEEFYAVYYSVNVPYDGPQGRTWQINWGLNVLHSFRAPAGTLERRRPVFAAIAKSFRINPAWKQRLAAINNYLQVQFNRQIQAGYDSIAAAANLSRQLSANNDAMIKSIDSQLRASNMTSRGTDSRSAADKFDDYIRGVETTDDPYYGTSQHSYNEQYHWTDGYGNYRNSNDAGYNPNQHENGDWRLMQPVQ
jgi:hypothetical protein